MSVQTVLQTADVDNVELYSIPQAPTKAVPRTYRAMPQDNDFSIMPPDSRDRDVEMSLPSTPTETESPVPAVEIMPSLNDPPRNKYRFLAICIQAFINGLADSAPGALIPYMEKYYSIGYAVVSLIFISNAFGSIIAAPCVSALQSHLGRSKALPFCDLLIAIGFIPLAVAAPFPAVVVGYAVVGFGFAMNLSVSNVFTATLRNGTTFLGLMHGSYGIGGIIGPLIATSIVNRQGPGAWHEFYYLTISLALAVAVLFSWSFAGYEREQETMGTAEAPLSRSDAQTPVTSPTNGNGNDISIKTQLTAMARALRSRSVLLGSIFIFSYQGGEVSISGWVISFLITARGGDPATVGNVTSGFWGGITLGRLALSPLGARIGERRFVYGITVGAAIFELLVWFVPNIIGEAVSLAIVGLLLGPVYPCATTVLTHSLPRSERLSGVGVVSAFGSTGGAVAPFLTGLLAQLVGTFVLHPIAIGLFVVMLICWFLLPPTQKKKE